MSRPRDPKTLDLFNWNPPVIAHREETVHAVTFRGRLSRAISTTLRECGMPRGEIASAMSAALGAPISENVLNRSASESDDDHLLNPERLWALCAVTGDWRPIAVMLDGSDKVVIDKKYLGAVREAMARAEIERLESVARSARREWRGA